MTNVASSLLASLPPIMPSFGSRISEPLAGSCLSVEEDTSAATTHEKIPSTIKIGNRLILTSKRARPWAWQSFTSSARQDEAPFSHWVRANLEYADYPYARFNVHLDKLAYTDQEYSKYFACSAEEKNQENMLPWTKEETDTLLELCHTCDLRWPVIIDRWHARFNISHDGSIHKFSTHRKVEDLQHRYYYVGSILANKRLEAVMSTEIEKLSTSQNRDNPHNDSKNVASQEKSDTGASAQTIPTDQQLHQPPLDSLESNALQTMSQLASFHPSLTPNLTIPGSGTSTRTKIFDLDAERTRRRLLDHIWNRTKEEEREEESLRAELREVEAQLRKLKKMGKFFVHAASTSEPRLSSGEVKVMAMASTEDGASMSMDSSSAPAPLPSSTSKGQKKSSPGDTAFVDPYFYNNPEDFLDASFHATAPVPTPGTPYLQSGRLFPPACGGHVGLSKATLKQMNAILKELGVPEQPIATKRSCDLYDAVRKDALTLLILQKIVLRKEAEVLSKRAKLLSHLGTVPQSAERILSEETLPTSMIEKKVANTGAVPAVGSTSPSLSGNLTTGVKIAKKKSSLPMQQNNSTSCLATQVHTEKIGTLVNKSNALSVGKKGPATDGRRMSSKKKSRDNSSTILASAEIAIGLQSRPVVVLPPTAVESSNHPHMGNPLNPLETDIYSYPTNNPMTPNAPIVAPFSSSQSVTSKLVKKRGRPPLSKSPNPVGMTMPGTLPTSEASKTSPILKVHTSLESSIGKVPNKKRLKKVP